MTKHYDIMYNGKGRYDVLCNFRYMAFFDTYAEAEQFVAICKEKDATL
jgi:hypothetical protein